MNIYEAIGIAFVILMTCIGVAVVGFAMYEGMKRMTGRYAVGELHEDAAVRDYLPGIRQ